MGLTSHHTGQVGPQGCRPRPRWWLVLPLAVLAAAATFELRVAMQEAVIDLVCAEMQHSGGMPVHDCHGAAVSAQASFWIKWISVANGIGGLLVAGLGGALSDRYGRRPVLVASITGVCVATPSPPISSPHLSVPLAAHPNLFYTRFCYMMDAASFPSNIGN